MRGGWWVAGGRWLFVVAVGCGLCERLVVCSSGGGQAVDLAGVL